MPKPYQINYSDTAADELRTTQLTPPESFTEAMAYALESQGDQPLTAELELDRGARLCLGIRNMYFSTADNHIVFWPVYRVTDK